MVFQTAPPHPASNARWTCAPELVGGAEASQNGLGERMPAKSMRKSAMLRLREPLVNGERGSLTVLHRHHGRCRAGRANTISAREHAGDGSFELVGHFDESVLGGDVRQQRLLLPDRFDDL